MENVKQLFHNLMQVNLLTLDYDKTVKDLEALLGIGPFVTCTFPPGGVTHEQAHAIYWGEPGKFRCKIGFCQLEKIEFEVIQPLDEDNIWMDFLKKRGLTTALHHVKIRLDGPSLEPARAHFRALGIAETMTGDSVGANAGNEWTYFQTSDILGFDVEVMTTR